MANATARQERGVGCRLAAAAARVRDQLDDLAEALLDHFVEAAREAGGSWSQIGATIGVSKQAAQQRHTATESVARRLLACLPKERRSGRRPMLLRRFTARARSCVGWRARS